MTFTMDQTENVASDIQNEDSDTFKFAFSEYLPMSRWRIMKNLIVLCLGYLFLFSAFMPLANLQSTMNNAGNIGVVSQSIIYGTLIFSTMFLPKLIIKRIGCKLTVLISILTYLPYIAANFYPQASTLIPTSLVLGAGAGTLWSSASTYINELSFMYGNEDSEKAAFATSLFFGIFLMSFQTTQIWGNLVLFYVLRQDVKSTIDSNKTTPRNETEHMDSSTAILSCGANFCGGINQKLEPVSDAKRFILVGIYLAISLLSAVVVAVFMDPIKRKKTTIDAEDKVILKLIATFKQMVKVDQLLLIALSTFSGLEQGFIFADYTEAYIVCAWGLQNVGLVFICFGVVNAITSLWVGRLVKYFPRTVLMIAATTSNMGVCIVLLNWTPRSNDVLIFFIIVGFWAFSDAIWQTQLNAVHGVMFRTDEEAAFANYRLWEALGYLTAFACSSVFCTRSKIYMQIAFLSVGMVGYLVLVFRIHWKKKCYLVTKTV